jgi:hypothetical protein
MRGCKNRRGSRVVLSLVASIATASVEPAAFAAPTAKDRAEARSLLTKGKDLLRQKRYADALAALKKADRLDASAAVEAGVADAQIGLGKLVEAKRTLAQVIEAKDASPGGKRARAEAQKAMTDLEARIPTVRIKIRGGGDKATTLVDGIEVDASGDIAVNPGDHTVGAAAPGFGSAEKEISLAERGHEEVVLRLAAKDALAAGPKEDKPGEDAQPAADGGRSRAPGIALIVVGGTALAVGAVFGGLAISATNQAKAQCQGVDCPLSASSDVSRSKLYGNVSTGLLIGGGAVAVTGIVLAATAGPKNAGAADDAAPSASTGPSARLSPWIGPGLAGLGASGRF